MPRYIRYLENGEYKYASVKEVGDMTQLKTSAKESLVEAINELIEGGVLEIVKQDLDKITQDIDSLETTVGGQSTTIQQQATQISSAQELIDALQEDTLNLNDKADALESKTQTIESELLNKANITYVDGKLATKLDLTKYETEYNQTKSDLLEKVDIDRYEQEYATIVENVNQKADDSVVQDIVNSINGDIALQQQTVDQVKTDVVTLDSKVEATKQDLLIDIADTQSKATNDLNTAKQELQGTINTTNSNVSALDTKVNQVKTDLANDIIAVQGNLDTVEGNLNTSIDGINTSINTINSNIASTNSELDTAKTDLANSITAVQTKTTNDLNTAKAELQSSISSTNANVTALDTELDIAKTNLTNDIAEVQSNLNTVEQQLSTSIGSANQNITSLTGRVSTAETNIANINTNISNVEQSISDTQGDLNTTKQSLSSTQSDLNQTKTNLTNAKTELGNRIGATEGSITAINTEIDEINGVVATKVSQTEHDTDISGLTTRIGQAETSITQNATAISLKASQTEVDELNESIASANAQLTVQAGQISQKVEKSEYDTLSGQVTNQQASIEVLADEIAQKVTHDEYDELTQQVSTQETSILQTASEVEILATKSEEIDGRLSTAEASIVTQAGQINLKAEKSDVYTKSETDGKLGTKVNSSVYNTKIAEIELANDGITQRVTATEGEVDTITGDVTTLKSDVSTLEQTASQIQTTVTGIESDVNGIDGRLSSAETQVTQNKNAIALKASQTEVDTLTGRVTTAESNITQTSNQIATKVEQATYDADMGVNAWIGKQYSYTNNARIIPTFDHIRELKPISAKSFVDSLSLSFSAEYYIAHFTTNVYVASAKNVALQVKHDDNLNILLNGVTAYSSSQTITTFAPLTLSLKAGWNTIDILLHEITGGDNVTFDKKISTLVDKMSYNGGLQVVDSRLLANETAIKQNAEQISLRATKTEVETLTGRVSDAEAELSVQAGEIASKVSSTIYNTDKTSLQNDIDSKASQTDLSALTGRVSSAESTITQHADMIESKVEQSDFDTLNGTVSTHSTQIQQHSNSIALKAEASNVYTKTEADNKLGGKVNTSTYNSKISEIELDLDGITQRVSNTESEIDVQSGQITQLDTDISTVDQKADSIQSSVTSLSNTVTTQGSTIASHGTSITQLNNSISLKAEASNVYTKSEADGKISTAVNNAKSEIKVTTDSISQSVVNIDQVVNEQGTQIVQQQSSIEQLSDQIAQKVTHQEYDELTQQVSAQETMILQTDSEVQILATKSDEIDGRLSTAEASITTQAGQIALKAEASNVYTKSESDSKLGGKVDTTTYNNKMSEIQITTDGITQRVTATEGEIDAITGDVTSLQTDVSTLEQTASQIQTTVSGIQDDLDSVEGRMSTAETQITQNKNDITLRATKTEVDTLEGRVDDTESQLTVQAGQIASKVSSTTYTTDKTALQNDINSRAKQTDLTALSGRVSTAESTITQQAGLIEQRVTKTEYEELDGDGYWIAERYDKTLSSGANAYPRHSDITGLTPNDAKFFKDNVDLTAWKNTTYVITYLKTYVYVDQDTTINLGVAYDDGFTYHVNDVEVFSRNLSSSPASFTPFSYQLKSGWNKIEIFSYEHTGAEYIKFDKSLSTLVGAMNCSKDEDYKESKRISSTETMITQQAGQIQLKANASDVYTKGDVDSKLANGDIYVKGTGLNSGGSRVVKVNGQTIVSENINRGLRLTTLNRSTLQVVDNITYDIYGTMQAKTDLTAKLNSLDTSVLVILTSFDALEMSAELRTAISNVGGTGTHIGNPNHRVPYALIGMKGIGKGAGIEVLTSDSATAPPAEISTKVINGIPQGFNTSATALDKRVSTAETTITQQATSISLKANASDVYTKTQADDKLGTKVDTSVYNSKMAEIQLTTDGISQRVTATEGELDTQSGQITTINQNVSAVDQKADSIQSSVTSLSSTVTSQGTRLSSAETTIGQHTSSINLKANASDVYTKTEADGKVTTAVNNAKSEIAITTDGITQSVNELTQTVDEQGSQIVNQQSTIEQLSDQIALKVEHGEFDELTQQVSVQETSILQTANDITLLASRTEDAEDRLTVAEASINVQAGEIALKAEKSDVYTKTEVNTELGKKVDTTTYNSKIAEIKTTTDGITQTVSNVDAKVNNIQIGGRNLLTKSGNYKDTGDWIGNGDGSVVLDSVVKYMGVNTLKVSSNGGMSLNKWITLKPNTEYVYSAIARASSFLAGSNGSPLHMWLNTTQSSAHLEQIVSHDSSIPSDSWKRIWIRFKTPNVASEYFFKPFIYGINTSIVNVAYFKLEEGNKPTDWTPAPEDMDVQFTSVNTSISNVDQKADSIQSSVTSLTNTVNSQGTRLSSAETTISQHTNSINLKAEKSDVYTKTEVNNKVSTDIATAKAEIKVTTDGITQSVTNTNSKIDNLKIGGANILEKTSLANGENKLSGNVGTSVTTSLEFVDEPTAPKGKAFKITRTDANTNSGGRYWINPRLVSGTKYTWSAWLKGSGYWNVGSEQGGQKSITLTDTWTYYTNTFTANSSSYKEFTFYRNSGSSGGDIYVHSIKLEEGEKATSWTPSILDTDAQFTSLTNQVSTIEQQADNIELTVGEIQSDITGLDGRLDSAESQITINKNAIALKSDKTTTDSLGTRLTTAEGQLTVQAGEIATKVARTEYESSMGLNKWIASKYENLGVSLNSLISFAIIQGKQPTEIKEIVDAKKMVAFTPVDNVLTHYFTNVYVSAKKTITLNPVHDDSLTIYLNGAMVYQNPFTSTATATPLVLNAGWNAIDLLHGEQTGSENMDLGLKISDNVDKLTAIIGVGNKDQTRLVQAESSIKQNADAIALKASQTSVTDLGNRVTTAEGTLTVHTNQIASKVSQTDFDAYSDRVETAESSITQLSDSITQKVDVTDYDLLNDTVVEQQTMIQQMNESIALKVDEHVFDGMNNRVTDAETQISLTQDSILLKADQTELDTVTGRLTDAEASITIQADQIAQKVAKTEVDAYAGAVKKVRYIRDHLNGSSANTANHWVEIKAFVKGVNVAKSKTVTASSGGTNLTRITDDIHTNADSWASANVSGNTAWTQVDLGQTYEDIDTIQVWHYYADGRTYNKTKTEISSDGTNWITVFDSDITGTYKETSSGNVIPINIGNGLVDLATRMKSAETSITQTASDITLKANQSSLDTTNSNISALTTRVTNAESSLTVQAGQIATKVAQTTFDTLNDKFDASTDRNNYVPNPVFDGGKNTYWTNTIVFPKSDASVPANAPKPYVGRQATRDNYADFYFPVKEGEKYIVEGWVASTDSTRSFGLGLHYVDESGVSGWSVSSHVSKGNGAWQYFKRTYTVSSGKVKARFFSQINEFSDYGNWFFTDVKITKVIEEGVLDTAFVQRITNAETSITQNTTAIGLKASQSSLDTLTGRVTTAEGALTTQANQIASKVSQTEFDSMKIGGDNLLYNSTGLIKNTDGTTAKGWTSGTTVEVIDNLTAFKLSTSASTELTKPSTIFEVKPNTTYTASFKMKGTTNSKGFDFFFLGSKTAKTGIDTTYDYVTNLKTGAVPATFTEYTITFTTKSDEICGYIRIDNNGSSDGAVSNVWFSEIIVQEGTRNTKWTPSSKDVEGRVSDLSGRMSTAETTITQQAGSIALKAEKTEVYTKTEANNKISTDIATAKAEIKVTTDGISSTVTNVQQRVADNSQNLIRNTSFKTDLSYWSVDAGVLDTGKVVDSNNAVKIEKTGLVADAWQGIFSEFVDASAGQKFNGSAYTQIDSLTADDYNYYIEIEWYNNTSRLSTTRKTCKPTSINTWERFDLNGTAPTGTTRARVRFYVVRNGKFWVSRPMLIVGDKAPAIYSAMPNDTIISAMATSIKQTSDEVSLNVVKKNNVLASINASSEGVKISGSKVDITGLVTFSSLDSSMQTKVNNGESANTTVNGWKMTNKTTINGANIETGTITANHISTAGLDASIIKSGIIDANVITVNNLSASNIKSGTMSANYISGGTIDASLINVVNLNASNIKSGTLDANYVNVVGTLTVGNEINLGTSQSAMKTLRFANSSTISGTGDGIGGFAEIQFSANSLSTLGVKEIWTDASINWYGQSQRFNQIMYFGNKAVFEGTVDFTSASITGLDLRPRFG